jgi:hypothetical protein
MNYSIFQNIIDRTFKSQSTLKVSIKISPLDFFNQKKSISEIHRTITNSKQVIGNQSNREFWKTHFNGGLYTYRIDKEFILIEYFLNTYSDITESLIRNLKTRIKKAIWCEIRVEITDSIKNSINNLYNHDGIGMRFIGEGHKIQQHLSTSHTIC